MSDTEKTYRHAPALRQKPCIEAGCLIVFNPAQPKFQWLNMAAWILFDLCTGRSETELRSEYALATGTDVSDGTWKLLKSTLTSLEVSGVIVSETLSKR